MPNEQYPVPEKERQDGPDAHPVGVWVLGEVLFPEPGQDPSWQGFIKQSHVNNSVTFGRGGTAYAVSFTRSATGLSTSFTRSDNT
jgi:hypothetical protein